MRKICLSIILLIVSSTSLVAEVKQGDLQKSLQASTYSRMSYDCNLASFMDFNKINTNFYNFAKKKYKNKSDHNQMIEIYKHGIKIELNQKFCEDLDNDVIKSRKRFIKRGLKGKFW